jgi:tetraacyldisaccharide 4'-kinase
MALEPSCLYRLDRPHETIDLREMQGKRLHALAGTGNPVRFFDTLARLGLQAIVHSFPDHHPFSAEDLAFPDCDAVVMTEKDAVKCGRFERTDLYALRVEALLDPAFFLFVRSRLAAGRSGVRKRQ